MTDTSSLSHEETKSCRFCGNGEAKFTSHKHFVEPEYCDSCTAEMARVSYEQFIESKPVLPEDCKPTFVVHSNMVEHAKRFWGSAANVVDLADTYLPVKIEQGDTE